MPSCANVLCISCPLHIYHACASVSLQDLALNIQFPCVQICEAAFTFVLALHPQVPALHARGKCLQLAQKAVFLFLATTLYRLAFSRLPMGPTVHLHYILSNCNGTLR